MREVVFNHLGVREVIGGLTHITADPAMPCIGILLDGVPWGGVAYTDYTGSSIQLHMAGRDQRWLSREMLVLGFHYPFVQLGVRVAIGIVNSSNTIAMSMNLRGGFRIACKIPYGFPDGDAVILTMNREDCPWIRLKLRGFRSNLEGLGTPVLAGGV